MLQDRMAVFEKDDNGNLMMYIDFPTAKHDTFSHLYFSLSTEVLMQEMLVSTAFLIHIIMFSKAGNSTDMKLK